MESKSVLADNLAEMYSKIAFTLVVSSVKTQQGQGLSQKYTAPNLYSRIAFTFVAK